MGDEMTTARAIQALHNRCAIYTSSSTAARLLDLVGWTDDADLTNAHLLEPCVGEGAILLEGVRRLIRSFRLHGVPLDQRLAARVSGFEFHAATAAIARERVLRLLVSEGMPHDMSQALVATWIQEEDFLLKKPAKATHVAANPPYLRWSKIPSQLAAVYRNTLNSIVTTGDISVAFLDRMLEWAKPDGCVTALISDRWMFAQYGAKFMQDCSLRGWTLEVVDERPINPFVRQVNAYSAIVRLTQQKNSSPTVPFASRAAARQRHAQLLARYGSLGHAGCTVRVGPALGAGHTFLVSRGKAADIEEELLRPYIGRENLSNGEALPSSLQVVVPYNKLGHQISLDEWPGFARWVQQHEEILKARSCVRQGKTWWQTIDAIGPQWTKSPKLLVPELCREPVATLDRSAAIPAHSLYAIWSDEWPIEVLQRILNGGLLRLTAEAEAPMLKHGWFRFYKRFLVRTPLPQWGLLSNGQRHALQSPDKRVFGKQFEALFDFPPDELALPAPIAN